MTQREAYAELLELRGDSGCSISAGYTLRSYGPPECCVYLDRLHPTAHFYSTTWDIAMQLLRNAVNNTTQPTPDEEPDHA